MKSMALASKIGKALAKGVSSIADDVVESVPVKKIDDALGLPPPENAQRTQIIGTLPTYKKAKEILNKEYGEQGKSLDFGAGLGEGAKELGADAYEPFPKKGFEPLFTNSEEIPSESYEKVTSLNVLNVVPKETRDQIVSEIGRVLKPGGTAVITTRGKDVLSATGTAGPEAMSIVTSRQTYQKGFTKKELKEYVSSVLGDSFEVKNVNLGPAGVVVKKKAKGFAAGGVAMNETEKVLAEGGMMDDAGTIEPTSGNEVPVGSLQEEVKDDVPAMLSEGEFVLPADVVRFIGLERLMKLRDAAKEGLSRMDEMGQMGNAEEATDKSDMFEQDDASFENEIDDIIGEETKNFAEGGYVTTGSSYVNPIGNPVVDVRQFKHDDGRVIYITYFNNKPSTPIPEGFKLVAKSTEQQVTTTPTTPSVSAPTTASTSGSGGGSSYYNGEGTSGWDNMSDADKAAYYRENPTMARVTQEMQNLFTNYTILGKIQNTLNPDFVTQQALIARGIDPTGVNANQLAAIANEGYTGLANLGYTRDQQAQMIADAIADKSTQAPADVRDIGDMEAFGGYQPYAGSDTGGYTGISYSDTPYSAPEGTTMTGSPSITSGPEPTTTTSSSGGSGGSYSSSSDANSVSSASEANARAESRMARQEGVGESDSGSSGGSSGGGGKIVCTAMNEAYGFGSFRNAVWLAYAQKNLTKEHEVGYHTLFLPLVNYAYKQGNGITHRMLRKVLENIARHRSADLRAEMRGLKRDTVGRVYRAILEPVCYAVGKMKK